MGFKRSFINTTGNYNTANGYLALVSNTTGGGNAANGAGALQSNTTGEYNTATGFLALVSNTTGSGNAANGAGALQSNITGQRQHGQRLRLRSLTTSAGVLQHQALGDERRSNDVTTADHVICIGAGRRR